MVLSSKNWALKDERPREKLERKGELVLTDVELVAILLGTGSKTAHVLELAEKVLNAAGNSLNRLSRMSVSELTNLHGVGFAKAIRIKAGIEIARRIQFEPIPKDFRIKTSGDAFRVLGPNLGGYLHREEFWMVSLNRRSKIIEKMMVSQGGLSSTIADPRVIFSRALAQKASSIIVAHNHPSGSLEPSQADIDLTKKLKGAGELLDIQLIDHLIISENNYYSFADSGLL